MHARCAGFPLPGPPARSSVLGVRPSARIRYGYQVPGTCLRKTRTRGMHHGSGRSIALLRYGCRIQDAYPVCAFSVLGARYPAFGANPVPGIRYQVPGTRYRVPAIWHLGPGTRHRSQSDAEGRTPSTEDRARPPENPHTGYASCIVHPVSCIHYIHEGPECAVDSR
jgi:hypothetical protein